MKVISLTFAIFILILPLFGCSVNTEAEKECITDTVEQLNIPAMRIEAEIPQEATLALSRDDGRYVVYSHKDYEITGEIFHVNTWEQAFVHISGRDSGSLRPILADNFPQEKYRCTWTTAGEVGPELWQSVIFYDGTYFYALTIQCPADVAATYEKEFSTVLSFSKLCDV